MSIDVTQNAKIEHLGNLATRTVAALATTFKSAAVSGNTVNFYTSNAATGTPAFSFNFPEEFALTAADLVQDFTWSAASYPNSTNPNLDGKTVVVFTVQGTNNTTRYIFSDFTRLETPYWKLDGTTATYQGYFNPQPIITVKNANTANITTSGNEVTLPANRDMIVDGAGFNFYVLNVQSKCNK